jgi:hypothetical protein
MVAFDAIALYAFKISICPVLINFIQADLEHGQYSRAHFSLSYEEIANNYYKYPAQISSVLCTSEGTLTTIKHGITKKLQAFTGHHASFLPRITHLPHIQPSFSTQRKFHSLALAPKNVAV